jgi:magnesium chelatase family protein
VGGGSLPRAGEVSLAHRGVLFLDELPEFRRPTLEALRHPLEEGVVRLARANALVTYPADVMLTAAMNPCPCGFSGVQGRTCTCSTERRSDFIKRVSPLIDRFDLTLQSRPLVELHQPAGASTRPSSYFRARVEAARDRQLHRFRESPGISFNSRMDLWQLSLHAKRSEGATRLLEDAVVHLRLSALALDRIIRMARTRADLEGHDTITDDDMHFAIGCRATLPR